MRRPAVRTGVLEDTEPPRHPGGGGLGTGIIGGLAAYPVAILFTGADAATVAFYAYIVPFLISTVAGAILAGILVAALGRTGALSSMRTALER